MPVGAKPKRLFKVAQEFNVATQSIVDTLSEHDFKVDNKPLTKVTPEMYEVLVTAYGEDKARLEEHGQAKGMNREKEKKQNAGTSPGEIETLLKPEEGTSKKKKVEPTLEPEAKKPEAKKPEKKEPEKQPEAAPEKAVEPKAKKQEQPVQKEAQKTTEKTKGSEPAQQKPAAEISPAKADTPATAEKDSKPSDAAKAKEAEKKTAAEAEAKAEQAKGSAEKPEKEAKPEPVKEGAEEASADKAQAKKPDNKEGEKAPEQADAAAEDTPEKKEEPKEPQETIRARSKNKLRGTRVLGTVSVPKDKAAEDDSADKKKKKKKRTRRAKTADEAPAKEKIKPKSPKKTAAEEEADAKKNKKKRGKKKGAPEISDKEIEKQVKETMTKMQGGKGKKRQKLRRQKRDEMAEKRELEAQLEEEQSNIVEVTEYITVSDLAELFDITPTEVITSCMNMGLMVSINQRLEAETIELIADEYDIDIQFVDADTVADEIFEEEEDDEADLKPRAPVVTVMGHVDHGKTSLLDYIKKTKVAEGEAGAITQHVGAYSVKLDDNRQITFLDTPGHEAFTAMRARGAQVTDIVILVVAADDSVMPQTIEAINHAQAAGVSLVVAINKVDKEAANPERIMQQLSEHNVLVEDYGGQVQSVKVSALSGLNIDELLEKVMIEAELLELKANPDRNAAGIVIESELDRGKGVMANILVQRGTLHVGDSFVAGNHYGRVRAMENEHGERLQKAGPSTPIQLTGFNGQPQAGDKFNTTADEKTAKDIANKRQQIKREQQLRKVKNMSLDEFTRRMSAGEVSELNIVIKGDVDGSIEALSGSLQKLSTSEVKVNIIHTGVGAISETDVLLASASNAIIIGFQVRPTANARKLAAQEDIDIRLYSIIYEAVDLVHNALEGLLSPDISEKITATVEVRDTFKVPGVGTIAGCYVTEGKITRNTRVRLIRDGIVVFTGDIASLKRFKDDAKEVSTGYECGIGIKNFNDIKVGDIIEGFEVVETKRKLVSDN
jgi:translation initiation factor IF-2